MHKDQIIQLTHIQRGSLTSVIANMTVVGTPTLRTRVFGLILFQTVATDSTHRTKCLGLLLNLLSVCLPHQTTELAEDLFQEVICSSMAETWRIQTLHQRTMRKDSSEHSKTRYHHLHLTAKSIFPSKSLPANSQAIKAHVLSSVSANYVYIWTIITPYINPDMYVCVLCVNTSVSTRKP